MLVIRAIEVRKNRWHRPFMQKTVKNMQNFYFPQNTQRVLYHSDAAGSIEKKTYQFLFFQTKLSNVHYKSYIMFSILWFVFFKEITSLAYVLLLTNFIHFRKLLVPLNERFMSKIDNSLTNNALWCAHYFETKMH